MRCLEVWALSHAFSLFFSGSPPPPSPNPHPTPLHPGDQICPLSRSEKTPLPTSLTCFQEGGSLFTDGGSTAHPGAGPQVELVTAARLQVPQDPLGGVWTGDVHRLQLSHLLSRVIDLTWTYGLLAYIPQLTYIVPES